MKSENPSGFPSSSALAKSIQGFLERDKDSNIVKSLRENDKKNAGVVSLNVFYEELQLCGLRLKPKDQKTLEKELGDGKGGMKYLEFGYFLKGMKCGETMTMPPLGIFFFKLDKKK